jgi:hypothetical protein
MNKVVKTLQAAAALTVVMLLVSAGSWAQPQESQSLGDIARKQREKKAQQEQKGSKTLTNEDLPHSGGISSGGSGSATASSSAGTAATASDAAASPAGEKQAAAQGGEDSATAAEKVDEARKELESLQHDEGSFERGIPRLEEKAANEHDESLRQVYANAVGRARQNLEDTRKKRAEAEKKLAEAEAAAKQAQQNQPQAQPEAPPQ